jgi:hypothetical protein
MELGNLLNVISWDSITEVHKELSTECPEQCEKKLYTENTYYTEEVISQFSTQNNFSFMQHVHKNNFNHCCSCFCYTVSQNSKIGSFLLTDNILHITTEQKNPLVLGLVILRPWQKPPLPIHMFWKHVFKIWWTLFPKCRCAPSCLTHASQGKYGTV